MKTESPAKQSASPAKKPASPTKKAKTPAKKKVGAAAVKKRESERKWGKDVMSHGYCIFPSILLQAQARLGLNSQEMMTMLQLAEHWWRADERVFPRKKVLAERVDLSERQVQRHIERMQDLKYVQRSERIIPGRGRSSNYYDLSGLVVKLGDIAADIEKAKKVTRAAKKPGGTVGASAD